MRKFFRSMSALCALTAIGSLPSMAAEKRKSVESEEEGVRRAIAFQRAKDRADARQARKQARNPEKFTYAKPQNNPENSLATEQKKDVLEKSADREAPPK